MAIVHFTLQGKGGVGKSFVSSLIAQFKHEKGASIVCIDTDPVNATFSGYTGFDVQRLELMNDNNINPAVFDRLIEMIMENPNSEIIVDNGASSFIPLSSYLVENQAIELLLSMGHQIMIHPVITGGQAMVDTLSGLNALGSQFPEETPMIVWLNEYFGPIEMDGKNFEEFSVYKTYKDRIHGIITIKKQSDLFGQDMKQMLQEKLTFNEAFQHENFKFMAKNRLRIMKKHLFEQIDMVLFSTVQTQDIEEVTA